MLRKSRVAHVISFASYRTSLTTWRRAGIAGRELRYMEMLGERVGEASLITYDSTDEHTDDAALLSAVRGKSRFIPSVTHSLLAPILHWRTVRRASVVRAYQLRGAWAAAIASMVHRKPFLLRTGYVWSQFNEVGGGNPVKSWIARRLERFVLGRSDTVVTASEADRDLLISRHNVPAHKIHVIPNPVDTELFQLNTRVNRQGNLITFVGRLEAQKRVDLLIEAIRLVPNVRLRVVGDGSLRQQLERQAAGLPVEFTGTISNENLPELMADSAIFVLPSGFEGTPKALLEAMATGCAVVVTAATGVETVVSDEETGLVVEANASEIASALCRLRDDAALRSRLGDAASRYVNGRHSFAAAADYESRLIREMLFQGSQPEHVPGKTGQTGDQHRVKTDFCEPGREL